MCVKFISRVCFKISNVFEMKITLLKNLKKKREREREGQHKFMYLYMCMRACVRAASPYRYIHNRASRQRLGVNVDVPCLLWVA